MLFLISHHVVVALTEYFGQTDLVWTQVERPLFEAVFRQCRGADGACGLAELCSTLVAALPNPSPQWSQRLLLHVSGPSGAFKRP